MKSMISQIREPIANSNKHPNPDEVKSDNKIDQSTFSVTTYPEHSNRFQIREDMLSELHASTTFLTTQMLIVVVCMYLYLYVCMCATFVAAFKSEVLAIFTACINLSIEQIGI